MIKTVLTSVMCVAGLMGASVQAQSDAHPALWSISDEDSTVYFFGSFHLLPEGVEWKSAAYEAAFADAETIIFETDGNSPEGQQAVAALIPQMGLNAPGVTLSSQLDEETLAKLSEVAPSLGLPVAALEPLKPWLASVMLGVTHMQALGFDPEKGVEHTVYGDGVAAGKAFAYLETPQQQIGYFANLPQDVQVEMVGESLDGIERLSSILEEMVSAWEAGDVDTIHRLIAEEMEEDSPEVYDALIVQRNHMWVEPLKAALAGSEDVLVVVGAGHMTGADGILPLLEAQGLHVTRH
ncbi:TraB/GumN family protein [Woodsholea maritima]|uniref:TraB/GumN family protein n=1 Tax=Woodsholea maritima TaxID=240237 RepID=UPI00035E9A9E|nr:TraB/GumN family protein [Woodsholea maritima]